MRVDDAARGTLRWASLLRAAAIEARASRRGATGRRIDAPTATTASAVCLAIFADAPLARAPRPYPPGLARWSASPSPFVRGVSPRGFAAAADAAEDRPPSDLDATPTPSRASTDDRPDASPTPRVTAPLDRHPTDENDGRDPDRARDREFRATPPASSSSRPPRPPRLVDVRRRALRRDSKLTLDALRVAVVAAADILEPSDVAAFCFQLRDRARLERHRWGAHADDDAALRALARALARVVDALHPENDPRAFVRLLHGVASLASAARGGHGVHPRASLVRGGDGDTARFADAARDATEIRALAARAREFAPFVSAKDVATVFWSTSRLAAAAEETVTDADVRTIAGVAAKAAVGFDEKDMRRARDALVGLGERTPIRWRQMIEAVADARKDGRLLAPAKTKSGLGSRGTDKKKKKKKRADGDEKDDERGASVGRNATEQSKRR